MDLRRSVLALAVSAALPACNPYHNRGGEYLAGSVDPAKFAPDYQGNGYAAGSSFGTFAAVTASYKGQPIGYYSFPLKTTSKALSVTFRGDMSMVPTTLTVPLGYVFDPTPPTKPFPDKQKCVAPANYQYDQRRDGYRLDEQGNIFTLLPDSASYLPIVAEVPVQSAGESCQDVKSAESVTQRHDVMVKTTPPPLGSDPQNVFPTGVPDMQYLAWAIIDPSADVTFPDGSHDPNTGLGPQRWGWFDHFLLAYLDGGYIPTKQMTVPGMMGMPDSIVTVLQTQNIYFPNTVIDPMSMMPAPGALGTGADILEAKRGDANYSPICHVMSFTPTDPTMLPTDAAQIMMSQLDPDAHLYITCIQVQ